MGSLDTYLPIFILFVLGFAFAALALNLIFSQAVLSERR